MHRLESLGLQRAGEWNLVNGVLTCSLCKHGEDRNVLYFFIVNGEVKYVGKTVQPLAKRMVGYKNPSASQSTNIKNKANILNALAAGAEVEIYVLISDGMLSFRGFNINLAAGLEDSLIEMLQPPWNGKPSVRLSADREAQMDSERTELENSCEFVLRETYWKSGFFNIKTSDDHMFGQDGETIVLVDKNGNELIAKINRRANVNGTPRIMGGADLRDWFRENKKLGDTVSLTELEHSQFRLA